MRGIEVKEYVKGPKELKVTDLPDPTPKNDEYLIQVHAAATNFFDILQIQGKYQNQPPFPWVAGAEFAGIVLKTPAGAKSPKFPVGSRVFGATQGAFATKCVAKEVSLLPVPEGWSFQAAAGLFVTAPTSYGALVVRAGIKKGDYVLIHAAAGGVGLAAVQASTPRKREIALSYGADHAIDTASKDWPQATVGTVWDGIMRLVKDGKMRGTEFSDERYDGLERVPAALTALGSRGTWGKVVVKVPQEGEQKSKL
ncbi:tRNA wybutosine-synthesizing protein 2 [Verticillium dahliae VDG1]|nr:tRNA wybutosine-synthesizing protein 2 [Verticillium dahliae VDG1]